MRNDGPWTVPENLRKDNGVLTLSGGTPALGWQRQPDGLCARWTATDQVPQRLIDAGSYAGPALRPLRFAGPTTGGDTSRTSLSAEWHRREADRHHAMLGLRHATTGSTCNSNFTYALERPADGDQFSQRDARRVYGLDASQVRAHAGRPGRAQRIRPAAAARPHRSRPVRQRWRAGHRHARDDRVRRRCWACTARPRWS
jgi:hypothetical protein